MKNIKDKIKMAGIIQQSLTNLRKSRYEELLKRISNLAGKFCELAAESKKLGLSLNRNWLSACGHCRDGIERLMNEIPYHISQTKQLVEKPLGKVPQISFILAELNELENEFGGVDFNKETKALSVVTGPITLEDVYLGAFRIELGMAELDKLYRSSPYFVIALENNRPAANDEVTHPHVSSDRLCEGEGSASIGAALEEGRLVDFFTIVKNILNTYNPDSAFVMLDDWEGIACHDCGYVCDRDNSYYCNYCDENVCEQCSTYCMSCEETICRSCAGQCEVCEETVCPNCIKKCSDCGATCCESCIEDGLCSFCKEQLEAEENEEQEIEKIKQSEVEISSAQNNKENVPGPAGETNTQVQSDGVGQAGVLPG